MPGCLRARSTVPHREAWMLWSFEGLAHLLRLFIVFFKFFFLIPMPALRCWDVPSVLLPTCLTLLLCKQSKRTSGDAAKALPHL